MRFEVAPLPLDGVVFFFLWTGIVPSLWEFVWNTSRNGICLYYYLEYLSLGRLYFTHNSGWHPFCILVANPYCEVPLIDRKEDAFPPQMRPYSEAREHCLITGLQLLCLYLDCKEDEEKKARMIHLLFNTKGVFSEYQDWTQFIELAKTVETTS